MIKLFCSLACLGFVLVLAANVHGAENPYAHAGPQAWDWSKTTVGEIDLRQT